MWAQKAAVDTMLFRGWLVHCVRTRCSPNAALDRCWTCRGAASISGGTATLMRSAGTPQHTHSAVSVVHSLTDVCESYDHAVGPEPGLSPALISPGGLQDPAAPSRVAPASGDLQRAMTGPTLETEIAGLNLNVAARSTLFDAIGWPIALRQALSVASEVANDPILARRRVTGQMLGPLGRHSFEPMYERDDRGSLATWQARTLRESRTEVNLKAMIEDLEE